MRTDTEDRDYLGLLGHERKLRRARRRPAAWSRLCWLDCYHRIRRWDAAGQPPKAPILWDPLAGRALMARHLWKERQA